VKYSNWTEKWHFFFLKNCIFRHVRIPKKLLLALSCSSVRLSVRPHESARLPADGFRWNLVSEISYKNPSIKSKFYLKPDTNIGKFTWSFNYLRCWRQIKFTVIKCLSNIRYFLAVDSKIYVNNMHKTCRCFLCNNGYVIAQQYYVTWTLSVLKVAEYSPRNNLDNTSN